MQRATPRGSSAYESDVPAVHVCHLVARSCGAHCRRITQGRQLARATAASSSLSSASPAIDASTTCSIAGGNPAPAGHSHRSRLRWFWPPLPPRAIPPARHATPARLPLPVANVRQKFSRLRAKADADRNVCVLRWRRPDPVRKSSSRRPSATMRPSRATRSFDAEGSSAVRPMERAEQETRSDGEPLRPRPVPWRSRRAYSAHESAVRSATTGVPAAGDVAPLPTATAGWVRSTDH